MGFWIDKERIVGAGLHTGLTANTAIRIKIYNAILSLVERCDGADFHTGCVRTVVTPMDCKKPSGIGEGPLFHIFHPGAKNAYRDVVFRLTGYRTSVAANAFAVVDDESVFHAFRWSPSGRTGACLCKD